MAQDDAPSTERPAQGPVNINKRGYLKPLVVPPLGAHTHTMILLHGRGSNAEKFGPTLLETKLQSGLTIDQKFPGVKFIFPTAKLRRSKVFKRILISQWFDLHTIEDPNQRQELQYEGLRESALFIHKLIRDEAAIVDISNIVIGGLSQGCAAALHVLFGFDDDGKGSLGGFVGMSGWLPFQDKLNELSREDDDSLDDDNPFGSDDEDNDGPEIPLVQKAVNFVREEIIELPPISSGSPGCSRTPIWLGHGSEDERVSVNLGKLAAGTLEKLGWQVSWTPYQGLGHWYSAEELDDVVTFLRDRVGFEEEPEIR